MLPPTNFLRSTACVNSVYFIFICMVHVVCVCSNTSDSVNGLTLITNPYCSYSHRKSTNGRRNQEGGNIISRSNQDNNKRLLVLGAANARHEVQSIATGSSGLTVILCLLREKHLVGFQVIAAIELAIQRPSLCRYTLK